MSVTVSAHSTASTTATSTTSVNATNMTVAAGDTALVLWVAFDWFGHSAPTGVTAKWDSAGTPQTMTKVINANDNGGVSDIYLFALRNPTVGNKTCNISWTGTVAGVEVYLMSFQGSETSSDAAAFKNTNSLLANGNGSGGNFTTSNLNITSPSGDMALVGWITDGSIVSVSQTQVWIANNTVTDGGGARAAGAGTVSFDAVINSGSTTGYCGIGFDLAQSSSGVSVSISGQASSSGQGSVGVTESTSLGGQAGTSGQGVLIADTLAGLIGQQVQTNEGSLSVIATANLSGQALNSGQGITTVSAIITIGGLTGTSGQGILTSIIPGGPVSFAILGQASSSEIGILSTEVSPQLIGQSAQSAIGGIIGDLIFSMLGQHSCIFLGEPYLSKQSVTSNTWTKLTPSGNTWTKLNTPSNSWTKQGTQC